MNDIKIAVIINSFNRLSLLKLAIAALMKWVPNSEFDRSISLVIFDAGSNDGTIDWLKSQTKELPISINLLNPGDDADKSFAAGLNAGVDYAIDTFPNLDYLLFYETDNQILSVPPLRQAIQELESNNKLGACGFTVRKDDGKPAGVGQPFPSLFNFLVGNQVVSKFNLQAIKYQWVKSESGNMFSYIDVVYTSPLVVKVKAWKDSGGLDAKTFPFSDCDVDWAKRMRHIGWRMGVIQSNDVIHDNLETLSAWSKNRALQFHRGRLNYFKKFKPKSLFLVWPVPIMIRHKGELLISKIFVKDLTRRKQLSEQFDQLYSKARNEYR
jgi:GT2 family glycosyltransferase